jgi:CheY-like chemotaxis protein
MANKILLIDDDADDRLLFCEAMELVAPEVYCYTASSGKEALTKLNNQELETPDIVFLDINLPVMNGWQFLSLFEQHEGYRNIPVIVYSTSSHIQEIVKAQEMGALCFFTKPHDFNQLKNSLHSVVMHLQSNSLPLLIASSPLFVVPDTA